MDLDYISPEKNPLLDSQPPTQPLSNGDAEDDMEVEEDNSWALPMTSFFTEQMMGKRRYVSCSKVHFCLHHSQDELVYLEDKSSNGTFVDGNLVGKDKRRPLMHNSYISIAERKWKPFVFMLRKPPLCEAYPSELTCKYVMSGELGKGACGTVRLAFRISDDKRVAVKIIHKNHVNFHNKMNTINIMNEVKILQSINHPCVIRLEDVIDTDEALYIILELADGGELFDKILEKKKIFREGCKICIPSIASAIKYLHSKQIAHRDLKPENILLDSNELDSDPLIKISDMGLSKLVDLESVLKTFVGTPQYLAPEVLTSCVRGDGTYSHKVDCWSMGVILYVLLTGCPPFSQDRRDGKELVRQIAEGDYYFDQRMWDSISDQAIDLVRKLLTVDVSKRPSAAQILNHPWLKDDSGNAIRVQKVMKPHVDTFKSPEAPHSSKKRVHSDADEIELKKQKILFCFGSENVDNECDSSTVEAQ
ncbi:CHEK2 [Lepeophtheirus salmonis]|uniref:CHEK2 n=1 Tax=Lepeophtheirus salmonis TaxID=72036 RepID=A0A7R8DBM3_LEPSM|nr:CHEK2 [Lepeophtheirus salmonis]CAF3036329.1 CHEK2 [Lepeophtheirus salmonis]